MKKYYSLVLTVLVFSTVYGQEHRVDIEKKIIEKISSLVSEKKYPEAYAVYTSEKDNYPASILFDFWGARCLMFIENRTFAEQVEHYKMALRLYDRVIKITKKGFKDYPKGAPSYTRDLHIEALFYSSMAHFTIGNDNYAIALLEQLVKVDERNAEAWYNLAVYYERKNDMISANRAYRRYLDELKGEADTFD